MSHLQPTAHVEKRRAPNLNEESVALMEDPNRLKDRVFANNADRKLGSMPPQNELAKLTKTGQQLAKAMVLMERARLKAPMLRVRHRNDEDDDYDNEVHISDVAEDDTYMQCCVDIIQAIVLSDFHIPFYASDSQLLPYPSCCNSCTTLHPLKDDHRHLANVGAKHWVIILTIAMLECVRPIFNQVVLKMVHELHAHMDNIMWSELQRDDITRPLNEKYCRYALALLGAKKARQIYRTPTHARANNPYEDKISSSFLLDDIETFAREQMRSKPKAASGYSYMAWVAEQCVKVRGMNRIAAAADCYRWYMKAFQVADVEGNDFISGSARIDAALNLVIGAGGLVALAQGGVIRRDFRSKFSKEAKELGGRVMNVGNEMGIRDVVPMEIRCLTDQAHAQRVMAREKSRYMRNVPTTELDDGDYCLVEWSEVLSLWNAAMKYYDKVAQLNLGFYVYGECSGWDAVAERLHHWTEIARLDLENHYAPCHVIPGVTPKRDRGRKPCAHCGQESNVKRCSGCQAVFYCSRECQKKDWKNHKHHCKK